LTIPSLNILHILEKILIYQVVATLAEVGGEIGQGEASTTREFLQKTLVAQIGILGFGKNCLLFPW
jgi:hypothetical protein